MNIKYCIALVITLCAPAAIFSQQLHRYEYAVKIVCGKAPSTMPGDQLRLSGGSYCTMINVRYTLQYAAPLTVHYDLGRPTNLNDAKCKEFPKRKLPCTTLVMDCNDISNDVKNLVTSTSTLGFIDGFAIIESDYDLDVEAVYTAEGSTGVSSFHTERVQPRKRW